MGEGLCSCSQRSTIEVGEGTAACSFALLYLCILPVIYKWHSFDTVWRRADVTCKSFHGKFANYMEKNVFS